jgi:hypothetical protein
LFRRGDEFLERAGQRADAPLDALGQKLREQLEEPVV